MVKLFAYRTRCDSVFLVFAIGRGCMGYIHCCGALRKTRTFKLVPPKDILISEVDVLTRCPVCGHKVVQLTRIKSDGKLSTIRRTNSKAEKLFKKLKKEILYEIKPLKYDNSGKFYLNYNEYGVIKRCYSNLSNLKLGLKENIDTQPSFQNKFDFT